MVDKVYSVGPVPKSDPSACLIPKDKDLTGSVWCDGDKKRSGRSYRMLEKDLKSGVLEQHEGDKILGLFQKDDYFIFDNAKYEKEHEGQKITLLGLASRYRIDVYKVISANPSLPKRNYEGGVKEVDQYAALSQPIIIPYNVYRTHM